MRQPALLIWRLSVFKASLKELAAEYPAITRVDVNAFTQRVVVSFEEFDAAAPELLRFVEEAELAARVDRAELRASEDHPTDLEPPLRRSVELGVAALSLATSVGLKISPLPTVPFAGNTAAALSILRSSPRLRRGLEERLGRDRRQDRQGSRRTAAPIGTVQHTQEDV